ncbi:MAG: hypothetical protein K9J17_02750 [Flavobacteriales bacterium]|nr:hypothetical protein [Flavobacteriales bacterium]
MAAQDELFLLIQSLSPSEKRYFKVNASKGGDAKSNYMQLFEAMDEQKEEYDEELLKKKHGKKPFVKYLSAEKKHLREQIMKQMRAFNSNRTVDNRINELLQDEMFYRDKGLNDLREKALAKAKELATDFERFHFLQEILERQTNFVEEFEQKILTEPVIGLLTELKQLSITQSTYIDLWGKNKEIFSNYRSGADIKDPMVIHRMKTLVAEVELLRGRLGTSFRLNRAFQIAYSNYYFVFNETERNYEHLNAEYQLFQDHPRFKEELAINYKICLANLIGRAHSAGKLDVFLKGIAELKSLPTASFNEEGEVFQNVYFSEHLHYINNGDFEKAEDLVPDIEEGLVKYESKINKARLLSFQFNIMIMYFIMHRFKEAAVWAEKVLDDKSEIKQGIHVVTRILLPIIHFEMGHHDLVENLTRSAYRYLLSKKRLHSFERLMVNYLKDMPLSADSEEFTKKLKAFDLKLQAIFDDPNESVTYGMEELRLWILSHLGNKRMSSLVK